MGQKNQMRNLVAGQATTNAGNSATDRSTELGATGQVQNVANQLLPTVSPSGASTYAPATMSPYAASTYAANSNDIAQTYAQQREQGLAALGKSGFGNSPGAISSLNSTLGAAQGAANTTNYRQALQDSLNQMLQGANLEQGISGQYGSQSQNESGMATSQAGQRVGMGSTAGDVLSGVSMLANPVLQAFTGGFGNMGKKANTNPNGAGGAGFNNLRAPSGQSYSPGVPA